MIRRTDLHDVLDGLIVPSEKRASEVDLSTLSLFELEALMEPKTAGNGDPLREHMHRKGLLKKKQAEDVEYTGQVNNGVPSMPEWPRAALGVDSAGRRASPEEKREQEKVVTPDVQHVEPHADGDQFVSKGAHDERLLGLFTKEAVSKEWIKKMVSGSRASGDRVADSLVKHITADAAQSTREGIARAVKDRAGAATARSHGGKRQEAMGALMDRLSKESALDAGTVRKMEEAASSKLLSGMRGAHAPAIPRDPKMFAPHAARGELSAAIKAMRKSSSLAAVGAALGRPF